MELPGWEAPVSPFGPFGQHNLAYLLLRTLMGEMT
jgi:hypothetical protein